LTRPKPNNKLDPKETLSKAIEEYNQDRGPEDEEISLDDCCRKFDSSEAGPDHEKEQKEWQEFVNKVNREIERLTELKRKYRRGIFGALAQQYHSSSISVDINLGLSEDLREGWARIWWDIHSF
jgi:hypothetical protein